MRREEKQPMVDMLGRGVYTLSEAAKLTGVSHHRLRAWFRGQGETGNGSRKPVFRGDYPPVGRDYALSFLDLVEGCVAGHLREHGVSTRTLRKVHCRLQAELQTDHPFARKELLTDGKQLLLRDMDGRGHEELVEALARQKVFPRIILPFLRRLDYDLVTLHARRWRLTDEVVLDPAICFGQPIIQAAGKPTAILAAAWKANKEDARLVAGWYGVEVNDVLAAVSFENRMAA
jgi:uncharacterized protein (DUF433 family)